MGVFSMDKTSTTSNAFDNRQDRRQVSSEEGQTAQNNAVKTSGLNNTSIGGANITGLNLAGGTGQNSNVLGQGALQVSGQGRANFDIQNVDADVIGAFGGTLKDVLQGQATAEANRTDSLQSLLANQADNSSTLLESIGSKLSGLAENQQTGGDSSRNKIVLYVVLAVIALIAVIFWRRSK